MKANCFTLHVFSHYDATITCKIMEPGSGNAASYPPLKPLKPLECLQRRSGIGGELRAFPCTMLMAVGSCCSHHPASTLITSMNVRFNRHANHAEGVQYAITSLSKSTAKSSS